MKKIIHIDMDAFFASVEQLDDPELKCKPYIRDFDTLHRAVTEIRKSVDLEGKPIRLMGLSVSNLEPEDREERQLYLFEE